MRRGLTIAAAIVLLAGTAGTAAAKCRTSQPFDRWLDDVRREAAAQGVSARTLALATPYLVYDQSIVNRDRGQGVFAQSFLQFSDRMAAAYRQTRGAALIRQHASIFARIEREFGVPPYPIAAFWGLETDFGAVQGDLPTLRSVTSLAYDCRRWELFREQLFAALKVIDRGDLTPEEMKGPWAGEIGQFQFLPAHYYEYAVDYDGDGRRDLRRSIPDALGSAGNFLRQLGWRRGEPWLTEVRVPQNLPWDQADLEITHPRAQWGRWGVTQANGQPLPADNLPASLLLPMGRTGPAFLAFHNFQVLLKWNQSLVYTTTAGYLATRIAGAPAVSRGQPNIAVLTAQQAAELQRLLNARGYDAGKVDGKLGLQSRGAVKKAQIRLGIPADSYPTPDLLERLRR
ncbi:MAG: lytic murein transglycosylase [Pseudorhodoplanes sp.]|nr:lytic murein transglycosylase [Pseudorhodoplanes sp.]MCL4712749.1 lytic murein transglycosylase [Pseudorhodoplanes sp.]MCQ3943649.1 lytic murein transglycosylase [Alphaproteobacteria bacterium]